MSDLGLADFWWWECVLVSVCEVAPEEGFVWTYQRAA